MIAEQIFLQLVPTMTGLDLKEANKEERKKFFKEVIELCFEMEEVLNEVYEERAKQRIEEGLISE